MSHRGQRVVGSLLPAAPLVDGVGDDLAGLVAVRLGPDAQRASLRGTWKRQYRLWHGPAGTGGTQLQRSMYRRLAACAGCPCSVQQVPPKHKLATMRHRLQRRTSTQASGMGAGGGGGGVCPVHGLTRPSTALARDPNRSTSAVCCSSTSERERAEPPSPAVSPPAAASPGRRMAMPPVKLPEVPARNGCVRLAARLCSCGADPAGKCTGTSGL